MKNRCICRKYVAVLALAVSAVLFLPEALFAQGAVVGYVWGKRIDETIPSALVTSLPTDAQLDKLTHVKRQMFCRLKTPPNL